MTILKDMLGNTLHEGSLMYWATFNGIVEILAIDETKGSNKANGELSLKIKIPFLMANGEGRLKEFVAVVNPEHQAAMAELLSRHE